MPATLRRNNPFSFIDSTGLRCVAVGFGINSNVGSNDSIIPASAAVYPYDGSGVLGGVASVYSQGWGGPNDATAALAAGINQYGNEPGGIDLVLHSGAAQAFVTGVNSGTIDTSNIASVIYLSPGIAFGQSLVSVGDTPGFVEAG